MKIVIIFFCIILFSCKSQKLSNRFFEAYNSEKRVSVQFINDSILEIEQQFYCKNISPSFKLKKVKAKYKLLDTVIYGFNKNFRKKSVKMRMIIAQSTNCVDCSNRVKIPNYRKLNCVVQSSIHPSLLEKIEFGIIYNFKKDTLVYSKGSILFPGLKLIEQIDK